MNESRSIKRQKTRASAPSRDTVVAITVMVVVAVAVTSVTAWALFFNPSGRQVIVVDGSSTVFPVTAAWAEELNPRNPQIQYVISLSGTGAGFEKFCRGDIHLSDASRPIRASEVADCRDNGIEPVEFQVAFDGLSVVVNDAADWVDALTVEELCRIWTSSDAVDACGGAGPRATHWNQLEPSWPGAEISLWGPGTDSGTFDYFVEVILEPLGEEINDDFVPSEQDNLLVEGVANDLHALSYFGYAYAVENTDKLKILAIDDEDPENGLGPVAPTPTTIESGEYAPLSRPLFVYGDANGSLTTKAVGDFLRFGLSEAGQALVAEVGYVRLSPAVLQDQLDKIPE